MPATKIELGMIVTNKTSLYQVLKINPKKGTCVVRRVNKDNHYEFTSSALDMNISEVEEYQGDNPFRV